MIQLTSQQQKAGDLLKTWWYDKNKSRNFFEIAGLAGTGKTTIIQYILKELNLLPNEIVFVTFTGKAALNLTRKGCPTKTIHSVFYELVDEPKLDANGKELTIHGRRLTQYVFRKRERLPKSIKMIVVDEGSMINDKMAHDMLSYGVPITIVGDLHQLDPVFGLPFFLRRPDVILTEIMRQKAGDPIIQLSQMILHGYSLRPQQLGPKCFIIRKEDLTDNMLMNADAVICGKNITRNYLNKYIREDILKKPPDQLTLDDKVIFRKNNWNLKILDDIYMINGLVGYVKNIHYDSFDKIKKTIEIDFLPDFLENDLFFDIPIDLESLYKPLGDPHTKSNSFFGKPGNLCEWGYAITCHLAQGSQYPNVLVYSEKFGTDPFYTKWLYTAVTRAESGLILTI